MGNTKVTRLVNALVLKKWNVNASKAMFAIKTTVDEEPLEHINKVEVPKVAWDIFFSLFLKRK